MLLKEVNLRHEHRGPEMAFSVAALLQEQLSALSLPQEHLAWAAQTQPPSWEVLQQVVAGWTILKVVLEWFEGVKWRLYGVGPGGSAVQ